jgi:hypothetical protein
MEIKHKIGTELFSIFQEIINKNLDLDAWGLIESSDQFQTNNYCGGFDSTENEFTFSYFDESKNEFWFQLSLIDIRSSVDRKIIEIYMIRADNY